MAKSKYTTLGGNFKTDGENIFYDRKLLTWANLKTFKYLWWDFAKDGISIYCKSKKMVWVDSGTFEVIGSAYWRDKNSVYYFWNALEWSDPDTFDIIPSYDEDLNVNRSAHVEDFSQLQVNLVHSMSQRLCKEVNVVKIDF